MNINILPWSDPGPNVKQVHDAQGQAEVLRESLSCLERAGRPGEVFHLPFTCPENPTETKWHPPEISPILKMYRDKKGKGAADE